ncbi:hypothetical protein ACFQ88_19825 [Paenibacillus sp. NPDC056579]|uniref:hypothetical protein n=1 Tax=unclassified Paenibacillus TaxID=185978 RepID=UPI001EF7BBC6|nr:hypothetical protein [Paenibacillus sp. H1-7]
MVENKELRDLKTHQMGAVGMHETRTTDKPVQINPPVSPNPGPVDMRDGDEDVQE